MRAILSFLFLCCVSSAQVNEPDRLMQAFTDRAMADQVARMATDERIKMYETLANYKPGDFHYQSLLAGAFIQKMRETMDPGYLDRASKIVDAVLSADGADYEALRLRSQIELERHNFTKVAEYSRELIASSPEDPWNWGTLGDSLMELGKYDKAAEAYQRMVNMRPDLSSYNRASYYRFVSGDAAGAIEVMKRAIGAGYRSGQPVDGERRLVLRGFRQHVLQDWAGRRGRARLPVSPAGLPGLLSGARGTRARIRRAGQNTGSHREL